MTTIFDLTPDPKNARRRTERSSSLIRHSLEIFGGMRSVVVDEHLVVWAGNGTIKEAAEIGIEKVKIVDADGDEIVAVRRSGLTKEQWAQYAAADNVTSDLSEWDVDVLAETHAEVGLGDWFTYDEIEAWDSQPKGATSRFTEDEDEQDDSERNNGTLAVIPIALTWTEKQEWEQVKERLGIAGDKPAFMALVRECNGG